MYYQASAAEATISKSKIFEIVHRLPEMLVVFLFYRSYHMYHDKFYSCNFELERTWSSINNGNNQTTNDTLN